MIKEHNQAKVAEHTVSNGLKKSILFWWALKVLKKRSIILAKVKSRFCLPQKLKIGVRVTIDVSEGKKI